jgi:hypothetical protein
LIRNRKAAEEIPMAIQRNSSTTRKAGAAAVLCVAASANAPALPGSIRAALRFNTHINARERTP